jgi:cytidylate kinase
MSKLSHGWASTNLEARIAAHVQAWEKVRSAQARALQVRPFVTISREFGCQARPLAFRLAQTLNEKLKPVVPWVAYDRELLDTVAREMRLRREIIESLDGRRRDEMSEWFDTILNRSVDDGLVVRKIAELIRSLALHGHSILVGRGSQMATHNLTNGLHVRLVAPRAWRVRKLADTRRLDLREAEKLLDQSQAERDRFIRAFFRFDPDRPFLYDLTLNNGRFDIEHMTDLVILALQSAFGDALAAG